MVAVEGNPLSSGTLAKVSQASVKVENLTDARSIDDEQLKTLVRELEAKELVVMSCISHLVVCFDAHHLFFFRENEDKLSYLESVKSSYLFPSAALLKILDTTPSLKTKMAIIESLGPRLTDPKKNMAEIMDMFRFVSDKEKVEGILKARANILTSGMFRQTNAMSSAGGGSPAGGRGGSGRGGGGLLARKINPPSSPLRPPPNSSSLEPEEGSACPDATLTSDSILPLPPPPPSQDNLVVTNHCEVVSDTPQDSSTLQGELTSGFTALSVTPTTAPASGTDVRKKTALNSLFGAVDTIAEGEDEEEES